MAKSYYICPNCGKQQANQQSVFYCSNCGTQLKIEDGVPTIYIVHEQRKIDVARLAQNDTQLQKLRYRERKQIRKLQKEERQHKNDRNILIGSLVLLAAAVALMFMMSFLNVSMDRKSSSFRGVDYNIAVDDLKAYGFFTIETVPVEGGFFDKNGAVKNVTIAGTDQFGGLFQKKDFSKLDKVIVYYYDKQE